jgi:hypothetical protein
MIKPLGDEKFAWDARGRETIRETGGSVPISHISLGK